MPITEGTEYVGERGTYLAVSPLGQENVWTAVNTADPSNIVVLKAPSADDTRAGWPRFQHEMVMHHLFKDSQWIRRQVDRIQASGDSSSPPILALEILETTLWGARSKRPFTKAEVRTVARAILHGLQDIHAKGLVYADLKMQNIMVSGFDVNNPGDGTGLIVKLGDLGIVMSPSMGKVQPIAYRAPEVHLKYQITEAADIWGFALIYCHLLEAQTRFSKTGLYDDLHTDHGTMPEREQAVKEAVTNDYDLHEVEYYNDCALPCNDPSHLAGDHWQTLKHRGLESEEIEFLKWVLRADPTERPTASAILQSKWFCGNGTVPSDLNDTKHTASNGDVHTELPGTMDGASKGISRMVHASMKRKHSDQPQVKSSREYIGDIENSVTPYLPWTTNTEGTASTSTQPGPAVDHSSQAQPVSRPPLKSSSSVAPYLPWLHVFGRKTEAAPEVDVPETVDSQMDGSYEEPKSEPLVANPSSTQIEPEVSEPGVTFATVPAATDAQPEVATEKQAARPVRPAYLGSNSSTGGTYLSYRP